MSTREEINPGSHECLNYNIGYKEVLLQLKRVTCLSRTVAQIVRCVLAQHPTETTSVMWSVAIVEHPNSSYCDGYFGEAAQFFYL